MITLPLTTYYSNTLFNIFLQEIYCLFLEIVFKTKSNEPKWVGNSIKTSLEIKIILVEYQYDVEKWLKNVDSDLSQFNSLAAHLTWKLSTFPDEKTSQQAKQLGKVRNRWKNNVCESSIRHEWITPEQRRKIYLMCRGPKFTDQMLM